MHARRRLPYRVTPRTKGFGGLLLLGLLLTACASPRYVGSIGRDGTYSNRGFGLAIRLQHEGLSERWEAIDPSQLEKAPAHMRPRLVTQPLDLDSDGHLQITERQEYSKPTLRLLSRTSSTAWIDVDVAIARGPHKADPLDELLTSELRELAKTSSATATAVDQAIASMAKRRVVPDFEARVTELSTPEGFFRLALIDHDDFQAEQGIIRRQLVKVLLTADQRRPQLAEDHDRLLEAAILNRRGSSETLREQW